MANPCVYIVEINGKLEKLTKEKLVDYLLDQDLSKLKTIEDALQEPSTSRVLQYTQERAGEAGGERERVEPGKQGEEAPKESQPPEVNEEAQIAQSLNLNESTEGMTKIANAVNDAFVKGRYGLKALEEIISKLQDTDLRSIYENVKKKIQDGVVDVKKVRERVMTTQTGSEFDQAVLMYDRANLEGQEKELNKAIIVETDPKKKVDLQEELINVQDQILDNALANRAIGRSASTTFRLRQMWVNRGLQLADMEQQYMASKGVTELSREQKREIQKQYSAINEARDRIEKTKAELDVAMEENAKLMIEVERLKELKEETNKRKKEEKAKKVGETIQKSNERITKSKDNLKKLGGNLNAGFDPRVALELSKIAAEKVYQGVVKFDELVNKVYEDVKDVLPNFTKNDVAAHILARKDKNGNYVPTEKSEAYINAKNKLNLDNKTLKEKVKAYRDAQKEVALKQFEWQNERRKDLFENKPTSEKIIDLILRWQRFAVLSYPSTMIKLTAAVGNQLLLKPFKFALNALISKVTPQSVKSKQPIWGDPKWSSISKYYGAFLKNFSVANLKEQFGGIDTKEMMFGNPHIYDEVVSQKGLLEMPGRAHGYLKSFIKNPEFEYAQEQQINYHLTKMAEATKKLDDPKLTAAEKEEYQKMYDDNNVTNEDVIERMNKLSLEHARWSIFMNDSEIVSWFRRASSGTGLGKALVRSEIPIVKIPVNYINRVFLNKYGLIQAVAGSGKKGALKRLYAKDTAGDFPGVANIIKDGTKDLTEKEADMLGRALVTGSMGIAFFALGYMNRKNIELKEDGSVEFFGVHLNKNLVHSPEYESMFSGAETAAKMDDDEDFLNATIDADIDIMKHSPFISMLQYGFLPNMASAIMAKTDDTRMEKVGTAVSRKVAGMVVPGAFKQSAQWFDTESGDFSVTEKPVKRKPEGGVLNKIGQELMLGVPGLRKMVPEVEQKLKNYNEGGRAATSKEVEKYDELKETYYKESLEKAKSRGAIVMGKMDRVPFDKLEPAERRKFLMSLKQDASAKAKKELFGEKVLTEEEATYKAVYEMLTSEDENQ